MAATIIGNDIQKEDSFKNTWSVLDLSIDYFTSNRDVLAVLTDSLGDNPDFTEANVTFSIEKEGNIETSLWTIEEHFTNNVTIQVDNASKTVTVVAMSADLGYFIIKAKKAGETTRYRKISVFKNKEAFDGSDATFTYVAYADYNNGEGYTTTFDASKLYFAILVSSVKIINLDVTSFTGLWQALDTKSKTVNYNTSVISTEKKVAGGPNAMAETATGPSAVYYKGIYERIYFTTTSRYADSAGIPILNAKFTHWVGYVDIPTNTVSQLVEIPFALSHSLDSHSTAVINVNAVGELIVSFEKYRETSPLVGVHNSPLQIWKSLAPEIIEDPSTPGNHFFELVTTISGMYSYPKIIKLTNNNLYIVLREYKSSGGHKYAVLTRSTDNGNTWTNLEGVLDSVSTIVEYNHPLTSLDWYNYPFHIDSAPEGGLNIALNMNEGYQGTSPDGSPANSNMKILYYIHSDDGVSWENAAAAYGGTGAFSKNIVTTSALTYAELEANFKIEDVSTIVDYDIAFRGGSINEESGLPYLLYKITHRDPTVAIEDLDQNIFIVNYDPVTSTWVKQDVKGTYGLGSDSVYGKSMYSGNHLSLKVYNNKLIDFHISRAKRPNLFNNVALITDTTELISSSFYKVHSTDVDHFGAGVLVNDILYISNTAGVYKNRTGHTITCDASNILEPLVLEHLILRTNNAGNTWGIVDSEFSDTTEGYTTFWKSLDFGSKTNYSALFYNIPNRVENTSGVGNGGLKIKIGKKI